MEKEFWINKWKNHDIGFHKLDINENLIKFFPRLKLINNQHIFVPLCGKTLDLMWLAEQGLQVTGIELSSIALEEFFSEHKLNYTKTVQGPFVEYRAKNIRLLQGDIFDLTTEILGPIDALFDRAATIALPAPMREKYINHLQHLAQGAMILLVAINYPEHLMQGPPFSVDEKYVLDHWKNYEIHKLQEGQIQHRELPMIEKVYLISEK
jgi:thiopurine S-methyltransferase